MYLDAPDCPRRQTVWTVGEAGVIVVEQELLGIHAIQSSDIGEAAAAVADEPTPDHPAPTGDSVVVELASFGPALEAARSGDPVLASDLTGGSGLLLDAMGAGSYLMLAGARRVGDGFDASQAGYIGSDATGSWLITTDDGAVLTLTPASQDEIRSALDSVVELLQTGRDSGERAKGE